MASRGSSMLRIIRLQPRGVRRPVQETEPARSSQRVMTLDPFSRPTGHPTFWGLSPAGGLLARASSGWDVSPAGLVLLECGQGKWPAAHSGLVFGLIPWRREQSCVCDSILTASCNPRWSSCSQRRRGGEAQRELLSPNWGCWRGKEFSCARPQAPRLQICPQSPVGTW